MNSVFHIEQKDSIRVIGYCIQTTNQKGQGRKAIPQYWETIQEGGLDKTLLELTNDKSSGILGINIYNTDSSDNRKFEYMIAVPSDSHIQDQLVEYTIPAMTWAVFPCTKETIGKTEAQAITRWLPKSNYKPLNKGYMTGRMKSGAPDIEHYNADGSVEVWIAVQEK